MTAAEVLHKAMFNFYWGEGNASYCLEPVQGRRLSRIDMTKNKLAEEQGAAIMKDRAEFEIESGMHDDAYITSVIETICVPTPEEAAADAELSERLLLVAQEEGPEAVADLFRQRSDLF